MAKLYQTQPFNTNIKSYYLWQIYLFINTNLIYKQIPFITSIYINLFSLINLENQSSLVLPFITKAKPYLKQITKLELINFEASQNTLELWLMNSQQRK